ncbi:peptidase S8/S53 domain-containing protein [Dichotomocladium elegans]|nr:peptidase S8/S53 domain-containing protein [Dichotomocladium elegans]
MAIDAGCLARLPWRLSVFMFCIALPAFLCRCAGAAAFHGVDDIDHPKWMPSTTGKQLAGRYIIEFDDAFRGSPTDFIKEVQRNHAQFKWTVTHDLDASKSSIFRGTSIQLKHHHQQQESRLGSNNAAGSGQHPRMMTESQVMRTVMDEYAIKRVYPVVEVPRPSVRHQNVLQTQQGNILSPEVSGLPFSHAMTQVDRVRQELGLTGKGVVVGIIDTGVDFYHPALGGGFGPGYKVALGYDLVGDHFDFTDPSSVKPSPEPLDICENPFNGHGTHVAGIIAAEDTIHNFTGVAPDVTLGMWRVFGCKGSGSNDVIIKAMLMAYEAGCNIINLSLGSPNGWPEDPTAVVADRIAKNNVTVVAAAGNDGRSGAFMISSPSAGYDTISVASIDNAYSLRPLAITETGQKFPYMLSNATRSFPNGTLVAYTSTSDTQNDGCQATMSGDRTDLRDKIVLVKRGTCTFDEKAKVLRKYGALSMLVYDKEGDEAFAPVVKSDSLPTAGVSYRTGLALLEAIKTHGGTLNVDFNTVLSAVPVKSAGMVSHFSSTGPTNELDLKPDIAGIGGYVFSTLPRVQGSYGTLSGTSMATPYVAGVCALYQQAHGTDVSPVFIREQLQNYAKLAKTYDGLNDNPVRQGAGLVQAYDSIQGGIHLMPGKLSFNDTAHQKIEQLTLANRKGEAATFRLRNQPTVALEPYNTTIQWYLPLETSEYNFDTMATLDFGPTLNGTITLQPGESITIPISVRSIKSDTLNSIDNPYPIYGGAVEVLDGESGEVVVQAPYIGVIGNMTELPVFDVGFPFLVLENENDLDHAREGHPDVLHLNRTSPKFKPLYMVTRLVTSTALMVVDVLDAASEVIGIALQAEYIERNTADANDSYNMDAWYGTYIPNGVNDDQEAVPVPDGDYFLRWRALKPFGDPANPDSWESVLSPKIILS